MSSPITTADNREMRGLWRHLLEDSVRRGWLPLTVGGVAIALLGRSPFFETAETWDLFNPVLAALLVYATGGFFVLGQPRANALLVVLPVSRAMRGRLIWVRYVAVAPTLYYALIGLLAVVLAIFRPDSRFGWILSPLHLSAMAVALTLPAVRTLYLRRAPVNNGPAFLLLIMLTLIHSYRFEHDYKEPPTWLLLVILATSLFVIAISYFHAPRLVMPARPRRKELRLDWGRRASTPPRRPRLHSLWTMLLLEPLWYSALPFWLLIFFGSREDLGQTFSALAGLIVMVGFGASGAHTLSRGRLMRSLPLSGWHLASIVMARGLITFFYLVAGYAIVAVSAVLIAQFSSSMDDPGPLLLALLAIIATLCFAAATALLRNALLQETAYKGSGVLWTMEEER
ncbi:MAG: hypothetical protein NTZ09_06170 [Candidatus Hydrogenedentes bacterium]|nr:hypothetical protein [Candidatus Hydrogenedentota bacterium]